MANGILVYSKNAIRNTGVLTISKDNWIDLDNSVYAKQNIVTLNGVNDKTILNGGVALESLQIAKDCGLANMNKCSENQVIFYAQSVPTDNIQIEYYIL